MGTITGLNPVSTGASATYTTDVPSPKWSIGSGGGSINSGGTFTAPGVGGTSVIQAASELWSVSGFTSNADNSLTSTSTSGTANLVTKLVNIGDYAIFKIWTNYFSGAHLLDFDGIRVYQSGEVYDSNTATSLGYLSGGNIALNDLIKYEVTAANKLKVSRNGGTGITASRSITAGGATGGVRLSGEPVPTNIEKPTVYFSSGTYQEASKSVAITQIIVLSPLMYDVPMAGLEVWSALDNAADGTMVTDFSGNGRTLAAASSAPALQTISTLNNQKAVYFSGSGNPLTYTGNFTLKHLFLVASVELASFSNYAGLFTGISNSGNDILVGNLSSDLFFNFGYTDFLYKKSDVAYLPANQKAPVSGKFAIIEAVLPAGFSMDGVTIGQQRALSGTKFRGWFAESLVYSRVLGTCERMDVYRYLAAKFFLWRENSAGVKIFPFANDKKISAASSKVILESSSISGAYKARSKSPLIRSFEAGYGLPRRQEEFDAAEEFGNQHYPGKTIIFEDNSVYPPRAYPTRMTSLPQRDSDNYFHSYKVGFTTV